MGEQRAGGTDGSLLDQAWRTFDATAADWLLGVIGDESLVEAAIAALAWGGGGTTRGGRRSPAFAVGQSRLCGVRRFVSGPSDTAASLVPPVGAPRPPSRSGCVAGRGGERPCLR